MAKCKKCGIEDANKNKTHYCENCKKCEVCLVNNKTKIQYKTCKSCYVNLTMKSEEYRSKMSKSVKGKVGWSKGLTKETNESLRRISEKKNGQKSWCKGLTSKTNESIASISKKMEGKKLSSETKEKISKSKLGKPGNKWSEDQKEKARLNLINRIQNGELGETPKSKWYEYKDIKVQGRSELKWIQSNYESIISKSKYFIETPLGIYIPDFETKEYLIEVKSMWTYGKLIKDTKKIEKMMFVSQNIKPILVYVDSGSQWIIRKLEQVDRSET